MIKCGMRDQNREKQQFLTGYMEADRAVARRVEALRRARELEGMLGGVSAAGLADAKGRLREAEKALEEEVLRWSRVRGEAERAVAALEDPRLREILERRYFQGETFHAMAEAMHYSERHVVRLHRQALVALRLPLTA